MPINAIGLVLGKIEAEKEGLVPPDSTRIGVISSLFPNPLVSIILAKSLADREVASAPSLSASSGTSTATTDTASAGSGTTGGAGGGTTGGTGTGTGGAGTASGTTGPPASSAAAKKSGSS